MILTGTPEWALKRVKDITYDTSKGHNPRWVRVWTTPPSRSQYSPMLPDAANRSVSVVNPQTGDLATVNGDKTGRGCSLGADRMEYGYDVKQRALQGRAIEAGPWCVLDLIEKMAFEEVIQRVWKDLPRYGKEQFGRQLLLDIIKYSKSKYSIAPGFPTSTNSPYFPAVPTGGPSVGFLRQIADQQMAEGWSEGSETPDGMFQVFMGYNAMEWMIEQRKKEKGLTVTTQLRVDDKTFGKTEVYEGIQFVTNPLPMRGYMRQTGADAFQFVEIDPYLVVAADGEGFKTIPNPDYYQSYTTVDGMRHRICEVGFWVHPSAMVRESLGAMPSMPGKTFNRKFDFTVNPIPDWELAAQGCNKDLFFFGYRMLHAYAPRPVNPELMGAFIYLAPVPQYQIIDPWSDTATANLQTVTPAPLPNAPASGCDPCTDQVGAVTRELTMPSNGSDYPADGAGVITLRQSSADVSETVSGVTIRVDRLGGDAGAASCVVTITEGTATNPENFGTPSGFAGGGPFTKTLNWADGNSATQTIVIPIVEASGDDSGKQFTVGIGTFTTATGGAITSCVVTIIDDDEA